MKSFHFTVFLHPSHLSAPAKTPRNRAVPRRFFYDYNVYKATEGFSANTSFIRYCSFRKKLAARHRSTWLLCKERDSVLGLQTEIYKTIINVPAVISIHPIRDFAVNSSCKKINAKINVITTLNLSIGTTFEASPTCNAL